MDFEFDVFVSYAHVDNLTDDEHQKGWVAKLHEALDRRLTQLLGKPSRIWRDPQMKGNHVIETVLLDRVKRAFVLVSVVSPRYVLSDWATRELNEFWNAAEQQGGVQIRDRSRIFKVVKTPVPLDRQLPQLRSLIGYDFFRMEGGSGNFREFDEQFGPEYKQKFLMTLDDVAQDLKDLIDFVRNPERVEGNGEVIFLAVTTLDLQDERDAIRRDLQQHGHTVLPARTLSPVGTEVEAEVREDLDRCSMSIHIIGNHYSLVPENATTSLVEIQNELAIERGERGGLTRLVWIPPDIEVSDPRQQEVIERLRMDPRMGPGADLLEKPLDELRTVIHRAIDRARAAKAAPPPPPPPEPAPSTGVRCVYLIYDQGDAAAVSPWANFLFDQGFEVVHPIFEGDEPAVRECHEESLRTSDGVVIFDVAAHPLWQRRKLSDVKKIAGYGRTKPAPVAAVCLLPPKTAAKEQLRSHEAMVISQWDGLTPDTWRPFINRLKA